MKKNFKNYSFNKINDKISMEKFFVITYLNFFLKIEFNKSKAFSK